MAASGIKTYPWKKPDTDCKIPTTLVIRGTTFQRSDVDERHPSVLTSRHYDETSGFFLFNRLIKSDSSLPAAADQKAPFDVFKKLLKPNADQEQASVPKLGSSRSG